ncbi:MAG: PIN domain-containing protein [Candidatus Korobacteraceae bacterium]
MTKIAPFLSVITLTELRYGIDRLPSGKRRRRLEEWVANDLPVRFEGRILAVDSDIAVLCGHIIARSEAIGRRMEVMDAFIAATAAIHQLTVVTHNVSHFGPILPIMKDVLDPWT